MPQLPTCSVIVPTYDRARQLAACLRGISHLDYPADLLQVLVVDDGSPTPVEVTWTNPAPDVAVEIVRQKQAGPASARNTGAKRAHGELLAFIDDDCVPRPDWLRRLAERYRAGAEGGVGGHTINALGSNVWSTVAQLVIDVGYHQCVDHPQRVWFTTNNLAVAATGFQAVGGFDPSYRTSEDREFCSRWSASGRRLEYEPRAVVEHAHELGPTTFWKLHFKYGRGAFQFHREQRQSGRPVAIEGSYYLALLREPFRRAGLVRAIVLEALLALWHIANTAGFIWEWSRGSRRQPD